MYPKIAKLIVFLVPTFMQELSQVSGFYSHFRGNDEIYVLDMDAWRQPFDLFEIIKSIVLNFARLWKFFKKK